MEWEVLGTGHHSAGAAFELVSFAVAPRWKPTPGRSPVIRLLLRSPIWFELMPAT